MRGVVRFGAVVAVAAVLVAPPARGQDDEPAATPRAECGPGSNPEPGMQGRVPAAAQRPEPFTCNTELLGHFGTSGGFKVERYVDGAGHECAYFDSTTLFPIDVANSIGTYVLDMADPSNPTQTAELVTPAMLTPHESLLANSRRGLLAAVMGNPAFHPGVIDVYDISADCRSPVLRSTTPTGILGHESGFAPDGNTFYAASLGTGHTTAVDVSNPDLPVTLWVGNHASHGLSLNADGTRAYLAARTGAGPDGNSPGLVVLDVSEIQDRVPNPQVSVVSTLTWPDVSIPQNAMPFSVDGHPYLLEIDEFAGQPAPSNAPDATVGAARVIDIADETNPRVVSNIRLEVHLPQHRAEVVGDPGSVGPISGYSGHYCGLPREADPGIVACSMIASGLRVFDIRDPLQPREVAYFNVGSGAFAMSRPSFVPERGEIWYADGFNGFHAVRVTNGAWAGAGGAGQPSTSTSSTTAPTSTSLSSPTSSPTGTGPIARTGAAVPTAVAAGLLVLALLLKRLVTQRS